MIIDEKFYFFDQEKGILTFKEGVLSVASDETNLWYEFDINSGMEKIKDFSCDKIKIINFPSTLEKIENFTFQFFGDIEEINFEITKNPVYIGWKAFSHCTKLKKVNFNNTEVLFLGTWCFTSCICLREFIFPKFINEMGVGIFENCKSLEKIYIPKIVKEKVLDIERRVTNLNNAKVIILDEEVSQNNTTKRTIKFNKTNNQYCGAIKKNLLINKKK